MAKRNNLNLYLVAPKENQFSKKSFIPSGLVWKHQGLVWKPKSPLGTPSIPGFGSRRGILPREAHYVLLEVLCMGFFWPG